jgi:class 3 adenylate cyclase/tetratricopeptide (TPR) repeat protein
MATCPSCGRENVDDARFCSGCGTRLEALPRVGERKLVTVLFADVTGSTELADRLDAEELRDVMSAWFAAVRAEIEAQGGTVEKYIGDAVMAVFGVPAAHEDDPARALRAALAVRRRLVELNAELGASHGIAMEVRIGINTGEAVTSLDPAPGEAMVTGVAVNAAARLEQLAEPGQTVVAERTARAAPGFRFEDLGVRALRGKEEPVRAFLLLDAPPGGQVRGLRGVGSPFVGRERELDLLLALQDRVVAEGRPHLVTVYGEPGVGKSRLVRELLGRLEDTPHRPRILVGRCLSYGDGIAYWPLAEILKELAEIADDDPAEKATARIRALAAGAFPTESTASAAAALSFTLGLDACDDEFDRLQPSAIKAELRRHWRTLLSSVATRDPLVVVVEDIHWADPALLELLEELGDRSQGPILFVCPARPELTGTRPTWGGGRRNASSVFLGPLSADAAGELVGRLLDVDGLPDSVRARILDRAEGNPFFLEEILRQLIDEGRIVRDGGRWRANGNLPDVELPDTVQAVLAARIDLLEPSAKHTLQQASVVGRIFWRGAVAALVGDEDAVDPDLRRLEERELVAPRLGSTMAGEEELAFSHILTRDVAYESLPRRERPKAHVRVASWIESTTGDRQREYVGLLAHHYSEAFRGARRDRSYPPDDLEALRRRTFALLLDAAHTSRRGAVDGAACSLAEAALEVAETPVEKARALESRGRAEHAVAQGDLAWRSYTAAVDTLVEGGSTDSAWIADLCSLALATAVRWAGTMSRVPPEEEASRYLELGLAHLPDGDSAERARLLTAQAFWAHGFPATTAEHADPERVRRTALAAAEMAERVGRPDLAVAALDAVQHALQRLHRYSDAYDTCARRAELAQTAGDLNELGDSYAVWVWNAVYLGALRDARRIADEASERLDESVHMERAHTLSWSVLASYLLGDWDRALADFDRILAILGERGNRPTSGFATAWPPAAFVYAARGDDATADRLVEQARGVEGQRARVSSTISPVLVLTHVLRGETVLARERLESVLRDDPTPENLPLLRLAELELLIAERRPEVLEAFAGKLRELHHATGARYLPPAADRAEGHAAADAERAVQAFRRAAAGFDRLAMSVLAAVARLDEAEALRALGRVEKARAVAVDARPALERAGFRREVARAVELSS